ncbi:MAG: galactokinase [Ruminococcus sp.]|jgi:galactokinase
MRESEVLIRELTEGKYDAILKDIYMDESQISRQRSRYAEAVKQYEKIFGAGKVAVYSAPGRSEVGGNHTDHQHGRVLAASVNLDAVAVAGYSSGNCFRIVSEGYAMEEIGLSDLGKRQSEEGTSLGLIRGVLKGLTDRGYHIGGCSIYVTSDVLSGSGLSSSASFETILGTVLSGMFNDGKISPVEIAMTGQYAENVYFDKPCGLMDQMACSVGGMIYIDFQDPSCPEIEQMDLGTDEYSLCIVDTKGSHSDLTEDYAMIPQEMKKVAGFFGKEVLRQVDEKKFYQEIPHLRQKLGDRCVLRAMHFFAENRRVKEQMEALKRHDFAEFLEMVRDSGNSSFKYLQNVYTNRDVQNQSVSIALAVSESILKENGVCRVHGGGFAGTIQAFVRDNFVEEYKGKIEDVFGSGACHVLKVRKSGGVQVI